MGATNSIIDLFTRHRVAANLAMIMMILSGLWAVDRINTQLDPTQQAPYAWVNITWRGASAEDVERLVVVPIEQKLKNLDHLQELTSSSRNGGGYVQVQFTFDANMTDELDAIKDRISQIQNLPADMEPLRIQKWTDYEETAEVLVSSDGSLSELAPVVRQMQRQLLSEGIDRIDFEGMPDEEIAIQVPSAKLLELNTSLGQIADEVRARSSDTPAGSIGLGQGERQLRSLQQRHTASAFEQMEVSLQSGGRLTRLGDIAKVERRPKPGQPIFTKDGKP
ncbi:MAG TPA: efflux RND transporter permease subunit, partial [Pseudomonadales bacterium]|nr:efflux RND transporter permease subunit [Pseudomonadales bacterium]